MKKNLLILKVTLAVLIVICSFHLYKQFNLSKKQNRSGIEHEANLDVDFSPYFDFTNIPSNPLQTWIPEEMEFRDIDDIETDRFKMVDAVFESTDEKNFMSVTVTYLYEDVHFTYEKDDSPVEVIEKDGIEYFGRIPKFV